MRLKISRAAAEEVLTRLLIDGHNLLHELEVDYTQKRAAGRFDQAQDIALYAQRVKNWRLAVWHALHGTFPTELESKQFELAPSVNLAAVHGMNAAFCGLMNRVRDRISVLSTFLESTLSRYTDLPQNDRLFVEDIDSFSRIRDINHALVDPYLVNGFLDRTEDHVQAGLEAVLGVPFHRLDWAGEINDLYTSNVVVNGQRRPTAFLLKGPGIGRKEMQIADCGKRGDQIVRLFETPADLFVVQHVGPIADLLIKDVQGKIANLRAAGKNAHFLIIDGQDTAKVLLAYGQL